MNRRYIKRTNRLKEIIYNHIESNLRQYIIITLFFIIGLIIGVIFINNISDNQAEEIENYINSFNQNLKENIKINNTALLIKSIINNSIIVFILWFMGTTLIRNDTNIFNSSF